MPLIVSPAVSAAFPTHEILVCDQPMHWSRFAASFIREGLRGGERVVCLNGLYTQEQIDFVLRRGQAGGGAAEARNQLSIWPVDSFFLPQGVFEPEAAKARLKEVVDQARSGKWTGVRFFLDMNWGSYLSQGESQLLECERMLHLEFLPRCPCRIVCHYERVLFAPQVLEALAGWHQRVVGWEEDVPARTEGGPTGWRRRGGGLAPSTQTACSLAHRHDFGVGAPSV